MYLLAVKSFAHQLGRTPEFVVLNDGSLTAEDTQTLKKHIPSLTIIPLHSITVGVCPKGGCWERLMLGSELNQRSYVIQLDSDTVTLGPIPEVLESFTQNRSFTLLGDRSYPHVEPMLDACVRLKTSDSTQVQGI